MLATLAWLLALSLVINGVLFLIAYHLQSDKLTDASYAISFISLAVASYVASDKNTYKLLALALVCIWALRIGGFLLYRVIRSGKDRRFDDIRNKFFKFGSFWLGQAITIWVLLIPLTLAFDADMQWQNIALLGTAIWLAGFLIETVADAQKYRFTNNSANKDKWIDSGLWRYSRHPNYFGEILVWIGLYLYALPALSTVGTLVGISSPVLIAVLLLFISGIPILEKEADKRWGKQSAYQAYKKRTSILIPLRSCNY